MEEARIPAGKLRGGAEDLGSESCPGQPHMGGSCFPRAYAPYGEGPVCLFKWGGMGLLSG